MNPGLLAFQQRQRERIERATREREQRRSRTTTTLPVVKTFPCQVIYA